MAKTEKLYYEKVGVVLFARSRRVKQMSISVAPYRPVRVNMPQYASIKFAQKYFESCLPWVIAKVQKVAEHERNQHEKIISTTKPLDIEYEAKRLYERLCELADYHNYSFNKVTIRNQKTRWGSCSSDSNISLNINLARLPQHLIDYVILHELAHTIVRNHSEKFWRHLDKTTDMKAKELDRELNSYTIPRLGHHMRLRDQAAGIEK